MLSLSKIDLFKMLIELLNEKYEYFEAKKEVKTAKKKGEKMGSLWRSEEMQRLQLFIQTDAAKDTIDELGKIGAIQFIDIRVENKTSEEKLELVSVSENEEADEVTFDDLELKLENAEKELRQMNTNLQLLDKSHNELKEMKHVLSKESTFFNDDSEVEEVNSDNVPLLLDESNPATNRTLGFRFLTGVVAQDKFATFERVLWRSLRGNLFMRSADIEEEIIDPTTGELTKKLVFIVFYQGEQSALRIKRICDSFGARIYPCSALSKERMEALEDVNARISEMQSVLDNSREARRHFLAEYARNIESFFVTVRKHKAIYAIMNMCNYDVGRKCLVAEGWCPSRLIDRVLEALSTAQRRSGTQIPSLVEVVQTKEERPTNFPLTEFTGQFQMIVDAYGVARYGEVNPGVFTIITFPFLFAIMFGDAGHATLILLASIAMIYFEKKIKATKGINDIFMMLFEGRYLVLVMAIFGIFTGFLYNDFFGLSADIFGTKYTLDGEKNAYAKDPNTTYPFGIDPTWRQSQNELAYENSMKMKLSVIIGVIQMTLGVILGLFNFLRSKEKLMGVVLEFVPQFVFMMSFFGYMVFLILYKWMASDLPNQPYLINVLIDMVLSPTSFKPEEKLYAGQEGFQKFLFVMMVLSIITLLIPKPIILYLQHKKRMERKALRAKFADDSDESGEAFSSPDDDDDDFDDEHFAMDEVIITNSIHGVEYILSCISNTASYLRLWALSLAHSQLSAVFYEQVLLRTIKMGNFALVFCGYAVWGAATIAVLCMMEALSAFLHALRLHWVEFQSKFFAGDGYQFVPFSTDEVVKKVSEDVVAMESASD